MWNNKKGFIYLPILLAVIVGLGLIVGGGAYWYESTRATDGDWDRGVTPPYIPSPSTSDSNTSATDTKTYTNTLYGFSFQYPANFVENHSSQEGVPQSVVDLYASAGSVTGFLSVFVSPTANASACYKGSMMAINGIQFSRDESVSDLAPVSQIRYATFHNGKCVDFRIGGTEVEKILQSTFKFTASASQTSVPGMSKYTDTDFGFSFWYPNNWTIDDGPIYNAASYGTGTVVKKQVRLKTSVKSPVQQYVLIDEVYTPNDFITDYWRQGEQVYRFDATDFSMSTMGGLHMFESLGTGFVIPLSTHNFVVAEAVGPIPTSLARTIAATDPTVATPVGTAEQVKVIQAEREAYSPVQFDKRELVVREIDPYIQGTAIGLDHVTVNIRGDLRMESGCGGWQTITAPVVDGRWAIQPPLSQGVYEIRVQEDTSDRAKTVIKAYPDIDSIPVSIAQGPAPLKVTFMPHPSAGEETLFFGDGDVTGDGPSTTIAETHPTHTYKDPGYYGAVLWRSMPSCVVGVRVIYATF